MGVKKKTKIGVLHVFLLASIFCLLGFYVFEANSALKDQFVLAKTVKYADELKGKNKNLRNLAYEAQSLDNLANLSRTLDLEDVKQISYIEVKHISPLVLGD